MRVIPIVFGLGVCCGGLVGQLRQLAGGLFGLLFLQGLLTGFAQQRDLRLLFGQHLQQLVHVPFILEIALFLLAAYNLPFARTLWSISTSVSYVAGGLFCAFTLLCAAVSLLFNRYTAKPLAIFFCILNALVFYFMSAYNTPIDKIMLLNVVQTDIYEVQDLLGLKLLTFLVLLGILPALIILKIRIDYGNLKRGLLSAAAVIAASAALCAAVMLGNYTTTEQFFRNQRDDK